ncbi:MAG TPA: hypothetical protein VJ302_03280 [Blastocatellia bacterium]|nr:hypothetical protein [Blastocatellia bacterium]
MTDIEKTLTAILARLDSIDTRINSIDTRTNSIDTRTNSIESRLNKLEDAMPKMEHRLSLAIQQTEERLNARLRELQGEVRETNRHFDELAGQFVRHGSRLGDLEARVLQLERKPA